MMNGYDVGTVARVSAAVSIPVIASGGAGNFAHMAEVLGTGHASAVAAASMFHFTEQTPMEAKHYLAEQGFPVRV
jgi:cyclase